MGTTIPKVTILDYTGAARVLGNRESRKIENNTYLIRQQRDKITLVLHQTDIISYHADGRVILRTGGWHSNTTKDRLNKYSRASVTQRNYTWYNYDGSEFVEGQEAN